MPGGRARSGGNAASDCDGDSVAAAIPAAAAASLSPTPSLAPSQHQQQPSNDDENAAASALRELRRARQGNSYLHHLNPAGGLALPLRLPSATAAAGRGGGKAPAPPLAPGAAFLEAGTTAGAELGRVLKLAAPLFVEGVANIGAQLVAATTVARRAADSAADGGGIGGVHGVGAAVALLGRRRHHGGGGDGPGGGGGGGGPSGGGGSSGGGGGSGGAEALASLVLAQTQLNFGYSVICGLAAAMETYCGQVMVAGGGRMPRAEESAGRGV